MERQREDQSRWMRDVIGAIVSMEQERRAWETEWVSRMREQMLCVDRKRMVRLPRAAHPAPQ